LLKRPGLAVRYSCRKACLRIVENEFLLEAEGRGEKKSGGTGNWIDIKVSIHGGCNFYAT
jgi:hypothetical protein